MNISKFSSMLNYVDKYNSQATNSFRYSNNLSPLSKDTVSFGASNGAKTVEYFKSLNCSGNYSVSYRDVVSTYKHFGFVKAKHKSTDHEKWVGPCGQVAILKKQDPVDPGAVHDLVLSLQYVDEFDGELFIIQTEPTIDKIAEIKGQIANAKSKDSFDSTRNTYARELQERISQDVNEDVVENDTSSKEIEKKVAEYKIAISVANAELDKKVEEFEKLKEQYQISKSDVKENRLVMPDMIWELPEKEISRLEVQISEARQQLENLYSKLQRNEVLDEKESEMIGLLPNQISFDELAKIIASIDEMIIQLISTKEQVVESFVKVLELQNLELLDFEVRLEDYSSDVEEARTYPNMNKKLLTEMEQKSKKIASLIAKANREFDKYNQIDVNEYSEVELRKIVDEISVFAVKYSFIPEQLGELKELIDKNITPYLQITDEERKARADKQVKKFQDKQQRQREILEKYDSKPKVKSEETQQQPEIVQSPVEETPQQPEIVQIPVEETNDMEQIDNSANGEVGQSGEIVSTQGVMTSSSLRKNSMEQKIEKFKSKFTEKIALIPVESVKVAISQIVDKTFDIDKFILANDKGLFAKSLAKDISQTQEFKRIKNSVRFAFLHSVYENSENKPSELYSLTGKQTRELFDAINSGKMNITLLSTDTPLNISLVRPFDMKQVDERFVSYNKTMKEIDANQGEKSLDTLLKYIPELSQKEQINVIIKFSDEPAFYELLADENCDETLKTTLLKMFWQAYDADNSTDYATKMIKAYEEEQILKQKAQMQQQKLDAIDEIDWTL